MRQNNSQKDVLANGAIASRQCSHDCGIIAVSWLPVRFVALTPPIKLFALLFGGTQTDLGMCWLVAFKIVHCFGIFFFITTTISFLLPT
jgi:hypothetical protein